jgi:hypothetical protein
MATLSEVAINLEGRHMALRLLVSPDPTYGHNTKSKALNDFFVSFVLFLFFCNKKNVITITDVRVYIYRCSYYS